MRIALVARRFDVSGGGTERDLWMTAGCLRQAGHDVTIYANQVSGSSLEFEVRRVGPNRLGRALDLLIFGYTACGLARRRGAEMVLSFARTVGADVIRSGGGAHASYVEAAARWRGALRGKAMRLSPYHRVQMLIERQGFASSTLRRVIAVSNVVRDDLIRRFGLRPALVVTLYNGVDLDRFRPASSEVERGGTRVALALPATKQLVIFVGQGFARKGLHFLLEAWPRVGLTPHLLVVGADRAVESYRRQSRRLGIEDRVKFGGPQREVEGLLRAADVLALPSLFEPFGNVVMEAMASGVPPLVSAAAGAAELLPETMWRYKVERPDDPAEIALRLQELLEECDRLRTAARQSAEPWTWQRYGTSLLRLIDSL
jgi:UDP-glucose:(heptosyl)LPS alpha-1,3-glucosyltransferase